MRIIESMWARIMDIIADPPMPMFPPPIGMLSIFMLRVPCWPAGWPAPWSGARSCPLQAAKAAATTTTHSVGLIAGSP
jgi:hypothetical protein